ncbi:MAG: hypothetical protein M1822_002635 [Bathelium mastoideum]|nr:MAG: hypothetical protein M1822_002635 [Bathelium mastoideum]
MADTLAEAEHQKDHDNQPNHQSGHEVDKQWLIDHWQTKSAAAQSDQHGLIARLFECSIDIYQCFLRASPDEGLGGGNDINTLTRPQAFLRSYHVFKLWGDDLGVLEGKLDEVLEQSSKLRREVSRHLGSIARILSKRCVKFHSDEAIEAHANELCMIEEQSASTLPKEEVYYSDSDSDSDSDDCDSNSGAGYANEILEDLRVNIRCLQNLTPALEWPAKDAGCNEAPGKVDGRTPLSTHHHFAQLVRDKFPLANTALVEQLGENNLKRYLRLQEQRRLNGAQSQSDVLQLEGATVVAKSKFHDSGKGTSKGPDTNHASTVAPSVVSSLTDSARPSVPPLPDSARKGEPFECDACGRRVRVTTLENWRKHLMMDLQPYTCVLPECNYIGLPTTIAYDAWIRHLNKDHCLVQETTSLECPLCYKKMVGDAFRFARHVAQHLEDIALATISRACDQDQESDAEADTQPLVLLRTSQSNLRHLFDPSSQMSHDASPLNTPADHVPPAMASRDDIPPRLLLSDYGYNTFPASDVMQSVELAYKSFVQETSAGLKCTLNGCTRTFNKYSLWEKHFRTYHTGPEKTVKDLGDSQQRCDVRCCCFFVEDDTALVCCDVCSTWQHIQCYYRSGLMPDTHVCTECDPNVVPDELCEDLMPPSSPGLHEELQENIGRFKAAKSPEDHNPSAREENCPQSSYDLSSGATADRSILIETTKPITADKLLESTKEECKKHSQRLPSTYSTPAVNDAETMSISTGMRVPKADLSADAKRNQLSKSEERDKFKMTRWMQWTKRRAGAATVAKEREGPLGSEERGKEGAQEKLNSESGVGSDQIRSR